MKRLRPPLQAMAVLPILLGIAVSGSCAPAKVSPQITITLPVEVQGRTLYEQHCRGCHGENGSPAWHAIFISRNMPDFQSSALIASGPDEQIRQTIREGVPETKMSGFPDFSDEEIGALIVYLRTLAQSPAPSVQ